MQTLFGSLESEPENPPEIAGLVQVLVPAPVDRTYTYAVPAGMNLVPGDYVTVPLGKREMPGVVWGEGTGDIPARKLKSVIVKSGLPPMPDVERRFIDRVAEYTMSPAGLVLKMAVSVPDALKEEKATLRAYRLTEWAQKILSPGHGPAGGDDQRLLKNLSPAKRKVLALLGEGKARRANELCVSASVLKGLTENGLIETVDVFSVPPCRDPNLEGDGPSLSRDQDAAARHLCGLVRDGIYQTVLLDGVTGAGKTEVYFEAVVEAVKKGQQVLILLPEIALSNAFLERFRQRFGCNPALWHSGLSPAQRRNTWRGVAQGLSRVVIGARSALFLPYQNLGLIIVDEEHDSAYKQEDGGAIYHARDMAVMRAHLSKIPIILVSATPSLETMVNCWAGRYTHLHLPDRHGGATMPEMYMIDLRVDKPGRQQFIAPVLKQAMIETLERGEQVLLFLNRRGYAPLTLCRTCGQRMECPRCTAWLVEHRAGSKLQCHHCGYNRPFPKNCPSCGDEESLAACGPGVERIYEEVLQDFPGARTMILASDTADSHEKLRAALEDIRERRIDIVIGTQIIAKGHHFPGLTLVGVIDADLGLGGGDLRAAERTYQLLHQVAGRAGREELKGHVYLQTWMPENRVMQALAGLGRDSFLDVEAQERERAHMPPYSRLVGIIVSGRNEHEVEEISKKLGMTAPQVEGIRTLGPAPAPFYRLRGDFRRRLLIQADKTINIQKTVAGWLAGTKIPSTVRVQVDIDPQSFL